MSIEVSPAPAPAPARMLDHPAGSTFVTINLTGILLILAVVCLYFSGSDFLKGVEWIVMAISVVLIGVGNYGIHRIQKKIDDRKAQN